MIDDLALRDDKADQASDKGRAAATSVREMASRIPESLSAIGRDISRSIERAISADQTRDEFAKATTINAATGGHVDDELSFARLDVFAHPLK
jgi:hypothetical protein